MFVTNSSASTPVVNQHTIHPFPRFPPPRKEERERERERKKEKNHTTSLDKRQLMRARMRSLRLIIFGKDVSVQLGEMNHAWIIARHPDRGGDLMSDERRPDWFPEFHEYQTAAITECGSDSFETACLLSSPVCTEACSLMTPVLVSWNSLRPCS